MTAYTTDSLFSDKKIPWLAPMAGISDSPFRKIIRDFDCRVLFSEMISAEGLVRKQRKTLEFLNCLEGDTPVVIQLFGSNPVSFYSAVKHTSEHDHVCGININAGCPVKKVIKTGGGCALMKNPDILASIVEQTRKATTKPVSVKLRTGWNSDSVNYENCAKKAQEAGADFIILHPRTAVMQYSGMSDWSQLKRLKSELKIKVVGNGDVKNTGEAERMMTETGCDAVMIGRAAMGNPWVFSGKKKMLGKEFTDVVLRHMDYAEKFYGPLRACRIIKPHLAYYMRGVEGLTAAARRDFQQKIFLSSDWRKQKELVLKFLDAS